MFRGVDHVGVGVGDMDRAMDFYGRRLGFTDVLFDHTGSLPGLQELTGRTRREARVVMLASQHATPLGSGRIKLVQVLDGDGPPPRPPAQEYGEVGICEVCLHTRGTESVHRRLVEELGCRSLMAPVSAVLEPHGVSCDLAYVADPWEGKVELIEWTGLWKSLPGEPRLEGVNHVAFGVSDMDATKEFYAKLGFQDLLFESHGFFDAMRPWYAGVPPVDQHMVLVQAGQGAGIEPIRLTPQGPDCRGEWGHVGPMEFGVGVANLEQAMSRLQGQGVQFLSGAQSVDVGTGEWKYAYLMEPDGSYVSLVEARY